MRDTASGLSIFSGRLRVSGVRLTVGWFSSRTGCPRSLGFGWEPKRGNEDFRNHFLDEVEKVIKLQRGG